MAYDRQTTIPILFTAGSTLRLDLSFNGLLASAGGSIALYVRGPGDILDSHFTYGVDGDIFTIDSTATITALWPAGIYSYTIKHTDTADIVDTVQTGRIEIVADPATETKKDARTFTEIFLDRIQENAKELARDQYKTMQIQDSIFSQQNLHELHNLIEIYENRLTNEKNAELNKQGINTQYDVAFELHDL